jgi:hypothetical protein
VTAEKGEARPGDSRPGLAVTVPRQFTGEQFDLLALLKGPPSAKERFLAFHRDNPEVYRRLVALTRQWKRATGRDRVGFPMLWERLRWDYSLTTTTSDVKLNNNMRSYYSRLIMSQEPDLDGVFETRTSPADALVTRQARE